MRETTMTRNSKYLAMALGAVVLLAGCNAKSPTAPKPQPTPAAFNISLTPESSTAGTGYYVPVTAQVTSGSGNAPDGTSVTFVLSSGTCFDDQGNPFAAGAFVDDQGHPITERQLAATTSGGRAVVRVTAFCADVVTVTAGVPGGLPVLT